MPPVRSVRAASWHGQELRSVRASRDKLVWLAPTPQCPHLRPARHCTDVELNDCFRWRPAAGFPRNLHMVCVEALPSSLAICSGVACQSSPGGSPTVHRRPPGAGLRTGGSERTCLRERMCRCMCRLDSEVLVFCLLPHEAHERSPARSMLRFWSSTLTCVDRTWSARCLLAPGTCASLLRSAVHGSAAGFARASREASGRSQDGGSAAWRTAACRVRAVRCSSLCSRYGHLLESARSHDGSPAEARQSTAARHKQCVTLNSAMRVLLGWRALRKRCATSCCAHESSQP